MMIGTCRQLNMFPPPDAVAVTEDDYAYDDLSASFPEIAKRLHNDHMRRTSSDEANGSWLQQRVMTAAFVVEFAEEVGVVPFQTSEEQQAQLQGVGEFEARVQEWTKQVQSAGKASAQEKVRECIDNHASHAELFFSKWIAEDWTSALWATADTVAAGAGAAAAATRFRPLPFLGTTAVAQRQLFATMHTEAASQRIKAQRRSSRSSKKNLQARDSARATHCRILKALAALRWNFP